MIVILLFSKVLIMTINEIKFGFHKIGMDTNIKVTYSLNLNKWEFTNKIAGNGLLFNLCEYFADNQWYFTKSWSVKPVLQIEFYWSTEVIISKWHAW